DGDGKRDCYESGISCVKITLSGTDCNGNAVTVCTTTDCSGNFCFTGLLTGTYTITETQPTGWTTTKNTAASEGGTVNGDKICNINLCSGDSGCGYTFGEKQSSYRC